MADLGRGERRLRRLLGRLRGARTNAAPPLTTPPPGNDWGWSIEGRIRRIEARLARLERLIGGGVAVTVLVEVALRLLERWGG
jgi:hypothetical protein